MSTTLKALIFGVSIGIIGLGCFGGYVLYQRHYLSSDIRRSLTAAMDPTATESDVLTYIRDARLQVRTERDRETLEKFETCVQLAKDASEIDQRLWKQILDFSPGHPRSQQEERMYDAEERRAKDEPDTAQKLYKEVRAALGLQLLPNVKGGSGTK
jgi:hypothetical protein